MTEPHDAGPGEDRTPDKGEWRFAHRLALVFMVATPVILGGLIFFLLKLSRG